MTSAQVVETSVNVISNSPSQDYTHPDDRTLLYDMTPGFKPFTISSNTNANTNSNSDSNNDIGSGSDSGNGSGNGSESGCDSGSGSDYPLF